MASVLGSQTLNTVQIAGIIERAKQWALLHGVQMRPAEDPGSTSTVDYAPMTLFPSLVPQSVLKEAKSLHQHFQKLMHRVAHDHDFLEQCLKNVIKVDEFTRKQWEIYTTVRSEGFTQPVCLGLFRNDFMMDTKHTSTSDHVCDVPQGLQLKQIEFNAIASSFAGLSTGMEEVHRYTLTLAGVDYREEQLPDNKPALGLARGMVKAWEMYNKSSAVLLFLVGSAERNTQDQKWLEFKVFKLNRKIRVLYCTFQDLADRSTLTEDKRLLINNTEVAVIYFRHGYVPTHYPTEKEYETRLRIERSKAIKCPPIHYQLTGSKKVQQELAKPGALERFFEDQSIIDRLRKTFAGQYSLDKGPAGDRAVKLALESPHDYVLKPQREGGGNNLYGEELKQQLEKIEDSEERSAYILMERIYPWKQKNHLLKIGEDSGLREVVSEIGVFGIYIGTSTDEMENQCVGHLLRTKSSDDNEGGICAGFATIDTPYLVE